MDRMSKIQGQKLVEQRLDFPFEKDLKTMDKLAKKHGQKIVETTLRFSI